jgi:hypothetical protein
VHALAVEDAANTVERLRIGQLAFRAAPQDVRIERISVIAPDLFGQLFEFAFELDLFQPAVMDVVEVLLRSRSGGIEGGPDGSAVPRFVAAASLSRCSSGPIAIPWLPLPRPVFRTLAAKMALDCNT